MKNILTLDFFKNTVWQCKRISREFLVTWPKTQDVNIGCGTITFHDGSVYSGGLCNEVVEDYSVCSSGFVRVSVFSRSVFTEF